MAAPTGSCGGSGGAAPSAGAGKSAVRAQPKLTAAAPAPCAARAKPAVAHQGACAPKTSATAATANANVTDGSGNRAPAGRGSRTLGVSATATMAIADAKVTDGSGSRTAASEMPHGDALVSATAATAASADTTIVAATAAAALAATADVASAAASDPDTRSAPSTAAWGRRRPACMPQHLYGRELGGKARRSVAAVQSWVVDQTVQAATSMHPLPFEQPDTARAVVALAAHPTEDYVVCLTGDGKVMLHCWQDIREEAQRQWNDCTRACIEDDGMTSNQYSGSGWPRPNLHGTRSSTVAGLPPPKHAACFTERGCLNYPSLANYQAVAWHPGRHLSFVLVGADSGLAHVELDETGRPSSYTSRGWASAATAGAPGPGHARLSHVTFFPGACTKFGYSLAVAARAGRVVEILDLRACSRISAAQVVLPQQLSLSAAPAVSADGQVLMAATQGNQFVLWDVRKTSSSSASVHSLGAGGPFQHSVLSCRPLDALLDSSLETLISGCSEEDDSTVPFLFSTTLPAPSSHQTSRQTSRPPSRSSSYAALANDAYERSQMYLFESSNPRAWSQSIRNHLQARNLSTEHAFSALLPPVHFINGNGIEWIGQVPESSSRIALLLADLSSAVYDVASGRITHRVPAPLQACAHPAYITFNPQSQVERGQPLSRSTYGDWEGRRVAKHRQAAWVPTSNGAVLACPGAIAQMLSNERAALELPPALGAPLSGAGASSSIGGNGGSSSKGAETALPPRMLMWQLQPVVSLIDTSPSSRHALQHAPRAGKLARQACAAQLEGGVGGSSGSSSMRPSAEHRVQRNDSCDGASGDVVGCWEAAEEQDMARERRYAARGVMTSGWVTTVAAHPTSGEMLAGTVDGQLVYLRAGGA